MSGSLKIWWCYGALYRTETILNAIGDEKCQMKNLWDCDTCVLRNFTADFFFFFFAVVSDWLPSRGAAHSAWKYFSVYKVLLCAGRTSSFLLYPPCSRFIFFFTPVEGPTIRRVINASLQICHSNRNKEEQIASVAYTSISIPAVMPLSDLSFLSLDLAKVPFLGVWPEFSQG